VFVTLWVVGTEQSYTYTKYVMKHWLSIIVPSIKKKEKGKKKKHHHNWRIGVLVCDEGYFKSKFMNRG
jgi:hypothetical protein